MTETAPSTTMDKIRNLEELGVTLRRAYPQDAQTLLEFERKIANTEYLERWTVPVPDIESALKFINEYDFYFAYKGEELIGTIGYQNRPGDVVYIGSLTLLPAHQMRGIVQALGKFVYEQNRSARRFEVAVHPENLSSQKICRLFGFKPGEVKENYFGNNEPFQIFFRDNPNFGSEK